MSLPVYKHMALFILPSIIKGTSVQAGF
uniref:Uncharacterized protein n=1 Tax=Anguilla anguilla TaxID=7936 RepID=A0A0E9RPJ8_ANGAN